jgi:hypothetical protein
MTEKKTTLTIMECEESLKAIFSFSIVETRKRLADITFDEREDNRKFDRIARTAVAFMRVAQDANALLARIREEAKTNDPNGEDAMRLARIARDEAALKERLDDYVRSLAHRNAPAAQGRSGGDLRESGRS